VLTLHVIRNSRPLIVGTYIRQTLQGVVCQGPNTFAVKGQIVDASGVAQVLRLTVSLPRVCAGGGEVGGY
jgi:hypothetical protein